MLPQIEYESKFSQNKENENVNDSKTWITNKAQKIHSA
jgi:hypothetical protein